MSFLGYFIFNLSGVLLNYVISSIPIDPDIFEITANILTSTQGFFSGLMYGDFIEYSGFHLFPFLIGGLVWIIIGVFLRYILRKKDTTSEKLSYTSKYLIISSFIIFGLSFLLMLFRLLFLKDYLSFLIMIFLAVIYVPTFLMGLITKAISTYLKE